MRKTKEEAEKTKDLILKAAIEEISVKGYAVTRLEDIAKKAKVTRGAIYHYYKNKNAILYDIHARNKKRIHAMMDELDAETKDPLDRMKEVLVETFARCETDPEYRQIEELFLKIEFASIIREDAELRERFHNDMLENQKKMNKILTRCQDEGKIRDDINIESLALSIMAFYLGFATLWFTQIFKFSIKQKAKDYVEILFNGILK